MIFGVTYEIDLSQPAKFSRYGDPVPNAGTGRITNLCFEGRPVRDGQAFVLVTNTYRASGGGNFPIPVQTKTLAMPRHGIRTLIEEYLHDHNRTVPLPNAPWKFSPISNTKAVFTTSAAAQTHLPHWPHVAVSTNTSVSRGFAEFTYDFSQTSPLAFSDHPAYIQS